jgi:hypothetical protein
MAFWSGNYQDDVYVADFDERGGLPQEIVPDQPGWLLPRCTPRHGCVLNELGKKSLNVWSLDPLRGKGPLLAALPFAGSAGVAPDLTHYAYIVEDSEPRNRVRLISFRGEPARDIVVANARFLNNLDWLSTGTGFSPWNSASSPTLMFITLDGRARCGRRREFWSKRASRLRTGNTWRSRRARAWQICG